MIDHDFLPHLEETSQSTPAIMIASQRTIEHHRASIMEKTVSKSLPALGKTCVRCDFIQENYVFPAPASPLDFADIVQ